MYIAPRVSSVVIGDLLRFYAAYVSCQLERARYRRYPPWMGWSWAASSTFGASWCALRSRTIIHSFLCFGKCQNKKNNKKDLTCSVGVISLNGEGEWGAAEMGSEKCSFSLSSSIKSLTRRQQISDSKVQSRTKKQSLFFSSQKNFTILYDFQRRMMQQAAAGEIKRWSHESCSRKTLNIGKKQTLSDALILKAK